MTIYRLKFYISILTAVLVLACGTAAQEQKVEGDQLPTLISSPQPVYPKEAKDAGIAGRVTVRVVVDKDGNPVSVDQPSGPAQLCSAGENDPRLAALRNSVVDAIRQAKFKPATKNGKPVEATIWLSSTFTPFAKPAENGAESQPKQINGGVINGRAKRLPRPDYPPAAHAVRASGAVSVQVQIDEQGEVFTAQAVSGHPLLRAAAVDAACRAKFSPTSLGGKLVRVNGVITYNFVP